MLYVGHCSRICLHIWLSSSSHQHYEVGVVIINPILQMRKLKNIEFKEGHIPNHTLKEGRTEIQPRLTPVCIINYYFYFLYPTQL